MATQADLDAINQAINTGAKIVKYQDREVHYRTNEELYQVRDKIKAELGQNTNTKRPLRIRTQFNSGL